MAAKKSSSNNLVKWTGTAGIESAKNLQKELLKAINSNQTVFLDLSEVEDIDLTGIQLILAAKKEAENQKKEFFIKNSVPQAILEYVSACSIDLQNMFEKTEDSQGVQ